MLHLLKSIPLLILVSCISCAQKDVQVYQGNWIGTLPDAKGFNFDITLEDLGQDNYNLIISNGKTLINKKLKSEDSVHIQLNLDNQLQLDFHKRRNGKQLTGFINSGRFKYHMGLPQLGPNKYGGKWNPFMFNDGLISEDILLYVENDGASGPAAYPFFGDQRFRGAWTSGFKKKNDTLYFQDDNTGFKYRAIFSKDGVGLEIYLMDGLITKTRLTHSENDWEYTTDYSDQKSSLGTPPQLHDGWDTANIGEFGIKEAPLLNLMDKVNSNTLVNVHSVLIAKHEKLVLEAYFNGFNSAIPHDLRSASKSISSAMIGIAINDGIIESVDEKLYDFVPRAYQYTKDSLKAKIKIKDLLTMSSGLDVNNLASEDHYQDPNNTNSWLKTVLEAPMVQKSGTYADYGSANPFLLGICLDQRLQQPMEVYMDQKLFEPLGITNYINQTDDTGITPYFGGGMFITPRDMLKFGQLYLNKGTWMGKRILSEHWIEESFGKHVKLQDVRDKNEYGYQWWHDSYEVNGRKIDSIEARGAGGQFIFILPGIEAVVVMTSGNFRNGKGNQPRDILKEYVLPAMVF